MPTKVIIGLQWGDEGKGKVVDNLVHEWADVCVRYQGGPNAGHTIYNEQGQKFVTHALPSGVLKKSCKNIITKGCVINPATLHEEIKEFNVTKKFLAISESSPLILPHHIVLDQLKYQEKIGTTAKGIGPAYADYISRDNKTMHDLCHSLQYVKNYAYEQLKKISDVTSQSRFKSVFENFLNKNGFKTDLESSNYIENFMNNQYFPLLDELATFYTEYLSNTDSLLQSYYRDNLNIILEGAQGWGLDVWGRSYPNVTSSSPNIGGVLTYTGLNHRQIDEVIGIVKIYKSKVGSGEFKTEWEESVDVQTLRQNLGEYGATTGRPRRLGWLDLDEIKSACETNGVDTIVITRMDSAVDLPALKVLHNNSLREYQKWNQIEAENDLNQIEIQQFVSSFKVLTGINDVSLSYGKKRNQLKWF